MKKSSAVRNSTCPQYSQSFHFKLQEDLLDTSSVNVSVFEVIQQLILVPVTLIIKLSIEDPHWYRSVNSWIYAFKSVFPFRINSNHQDFTIFFHSAQIWWQKTNCSAPVFWEALCWPGTINKYVWEALCWPGTILSPHHQSFNCEINIVII